MRAWILMADPDPARRSVSLPAIAERSLVDSLLLLVSSGFVLSSIVLVAGVKGWRALRAQGAHRLFAWVARAVLAIAVVGAAYHARIVVADLASFHDTIDRLIEYERANPPGQANQ